MPQPSTGTYAPAKAWVSRGVSITAARVEQTVMTTDSATLAFVAGIGQPPGAVSVWGFADAEAATTAFSGLSGRGFTELPSKMIANGEPGIVDLATRDPADPWRGPMGQASVVGLSGPALLQAGDAAALEPLPADQRLFTNVEEWS